MTTHPGVSLLMKHTCGIREAQHQMLCKSGEETLCYASLKVITKLFLIDVASAVTLCNHVHCEMVALVFHSDSATLSVMCHGTCLQNY